MCIRDRVKGRFKGPQGPTEARESPDSTGDVNRKIPRDQDKEREDPWGKARSAAKEGWQPKAWTPPAAERR